MGGLIGLAGNVDWASCFDREVPRGVASQLGFPVVALLFTGDDFAQTDLRIV